MRETGTSPRDRRSGKPGRAARAHGGVAVEGRSPPRLTPRALGLVPVPLRSTCYERGQARQWRSPCGRFLLRQSKGVCGVRYRRPNGRAASFWLVLEANADGLTGRRVISTHRALRPALAGVRRVLARAGEGNLADVGGAKAKQGKGT